MPAPVFAQSASDLFESLRADEQRAQRVEQLQDATPQAPTAARQERPEQELTSEFCFEINQVVVEGAMTVSEGRLRPAIARYEGTCIGLAEINDVLRGVTEVYFDQGYVTSRAFIPEQDIAATRVLRVLVVEGTLANIYLDGQPAPNSGRVATAFPGLKGKIVNLRDIEQGLDQINRLRVNDAKTEMLPGPEDGTSILNVTNERGRPVQIYASLNNLGQESTGELKASVGITFEDMLGLNEQVSFSYERTATDFDTFDSDETYSNSFSGSFSVPYGYWTLSGGASYYEYLNQVEGNFGPIETNGDSSSIDMRLERVIHRNQTSITTTYGSLAYKESNNFLLGNRIEVGSRQYTVASFGLSHSTRALGGVLVLDGAYEKGVDLFGAVDPGDIGAGDADPRFDKWVATLSYQRAFKIAEQNFQFSTLLSGQYSEDALFGAEQMSLGSHSNVRGTKNALLFGNSGFFSRNEISTRVPIQLKPDAKPIATLQPFVGLDYGRIFGNQIHEGGDLAGWTVGLRSGTKLSSFEVGYSDLFYSSESYENSGQFFASASIRW